MAKKTYSLYWFFKVFFLFQTLRIWSDRVYLVGLKNIPKNKGVLFAGNHPNSFLDGVLIEQLLTRPTFSLVRGDMFNKKMANWALRSMRLLPIYRTRDASAAKGLAGNSKTYQEMEALLDQQKPILIFSEGIAYPEKRLRPLKKGTARMVLEMPDNLNDPSNFLVQPVGFNYDQFFNSGTNVSLIFDEPKTREDLIKGQHDQSVPQKVLHINQWIKDRLTDLTITLQEKTEAIQNTALEIVRNDKSYGVSFFQYHRTYLDQQKKMLQWVSEGNLSQVEEYHNQLNQNNLCDIDVKPQVFTFRRLLSVLLFGASFIGIITHLPLWLMCKHIANTKIKNPVFKDSIHFALIMGLEIIMTLLVLPIMMLVLSKGWLWFLGLKACAYVYLVFRPEYRHFAGTIKGITKGKKRKQLRKLRADLVAQAQF